MENSYLEQALQTGAFPQLRTDLLVLAQLFRSYCATDPRDKIYGILGLASALETDRLSSQIDADYDLDPNELFLRIARLVTSGPDGLRLLRNVDNSSEQSSNLPSWVPDWSRPLKTRPLEELCGPEFHFSSQRPIIMNPPSPDILKIAGKRIDTVAAVGEVLEDSGQRGLEIWGSWITLGSKFGFTPPTHFNWGAFALPQDYSGWLYPEKGVDYHQNKIPNHCFEICSGRRYLLSEQRRSGLVPAGARRGDEIVLFPGVRLPLVLSKSDSDNSFRVVGECYLDRVILDNLMKEKNYKRRVYCLK